MSVNRENVIWQSKDGKWNRGFFECYPVNQDSEDWDFEWDVEYSFDVFEWVSVGHPTQDAAYQSWDGGNPGGYDLYEWSPERAEVIARFDKMAGVKR